MSTNRKDDWEPYWRDDKDWLCTVEFLPTDDPEARLFAADIIGYLCGGAPARLGYYDNYLVDNPSCVIVGVQATVARMSQETVAAQDMLQRFAQWQGREPESLAADTTYGNGEFLQWLADRDITPYMRTRDSIHRKRKWSVMSIRIYGYYELLRLQPLLANPMPSRTPRI